ncbi:MAG: hypothetical protein U9P90_02065 [Patescibacteria group bacterium]|nr:hypothetical protein [Patescibacteria group bacterium]
MNQELLPVFLPDTTIINNLVCYQKKENKIYYFVGCEPIFSHYIDEKMEFRYITSAFIAAGKCKQVDIIRTFGVSKISVKRWAKVYREEGIEGFAGKKGKKRKRCGHVLDDEKLQHAQKLFDEGKTRTDVAKKIGVLRDTLVKAIYAGRIIETKKKNIKSKSERTAEDAAAATGMGTACHRTGERMMAALGQLNGATTLFEDNNDIKFGGVLFGLPALLSNGLLRFRRKYFETSEYFYTNVQILLVLAYMALARIKSIEQLRYVPVGELGKVLGLDKAPSAQVVRDKVRKLAYFADIKKWEKELAKFWLEEQKDYIGIFYIDGHVRTYYGKIARPSKKYVSGKKLCLRSMVDYWVNDSLGQPIMVFRHTATQGIIQAIQKEIIPDILELLPEQPSKKEFEKDSNLYRCTLIFDREGYSYDFFETLMKEHQIACITYKKYQGNDWPESKFKTITEKSIIGGEEVKMQIAERKISINGIKGREIRKLCKDGHQTAIITTDLVTPTGKLAVHMFNRWGQENFFKYMKEHFGLDRLCEFGAEDPDATELTINPLWKAKETEIRQKAGMIVKKERELAKTEIKNKKDREKGRINDKAIKEYEEKSNKLYNEIIELEAEKAGLSEAKKQIDHYIKISELTGIEKITQPRLTCKRFTDVIKMISYRAECGIVSELRKNMARLNDARALAREIFTNEADIKVDAENKALRVKLHGLSTPCSNKIMESLIKTLNETETIYPGTELRMIFETSLKLNS